MGNGETRQRRHLIKNLLVMWLIVILAECILYTAAITVIVAVEYRMVDLPLIWQTAIDSINVLIVMVSVGVSVSTSLTLRAASIL